MTVYAVILLKIHDQATYDKYVAAAPAVMGKLGIAVQPLAMDDSPIVVEGDWDYSKCVVMKAESAELIQKLFNHPEYKEVAKLRYASATSQIVVLKAMPGQ